MFRAGVWLSDHPSGRRQRTSRGPSLHRNKLFHNSRALFDTFILSFENDLPLFHDIVFSGKIQGHLRIRFNQQNGDSILLDFGGDVGDQLDDQRGQSFGRFIHQ